MRVIGIDTGLHGAIAILNGGDPIVHDIPSFLTEKANCKKRFEYDVPALYAILRPLAGTDTLVCMEQVSSFPGQSSTSTFSQGRGIGIIEGLLVSLSLPFHRVRPQVWKKVLGLNKDKKQCTLRAREMFPTLDLPFSKDGRAEALLIAHYANLHLVRSHQ